ncbi:CGLAU_01105 family protein [Corynebacterium sp.]|uniref:CGLAU_01105 family protein n=1 Tax=Corynebacterium sp. TaxID=1720 RepID=UPI0026E07A98|nr:CGLAU_01105 family protein [Corynebacterium sp.]MDO5513060.1 CGLAU_01105 family protein [Corynebacterium sp.]
MTTPNDNNNSVLDNLREPFQAWVSAGARLGDVVSDFAERFRADRERTDAPSDVHSVYSGESATAGQSAKERFTTAAQEARAGLTGAKSTEDYKNVSLAFAGRAEEIIRDLAGSVRRAAGETKDSDSATEAKAAFTSAVSSVRSTFDETVEQARARRAAGTGDEAGEQSFIDDLRRRLDDLIARASTVVDKDSAATAPETTANAEDGAVPHMIDGEVVSTDDVSHPNNKDN